MSLHRSGSNSVQTTSHAIASNRSLRRWKEKNDQINKGGLHNSLASVESDLPMNAFGAALATQLRHPLFLEGIADRDQKLIRGVGAQRRVSSKNIVIRAGERASHLFLLKSGLARYYRSTKEGKELLLRWLFPGDIFGPATLLKNPPDYIGSVEAVEDCELLVWDHLCVRELSTVYPQLAENALCIFLGYISDAVERYEGVVTGSSESRLAGTLLQLGHRAGRVGATGVEVDITNEDLAGLADVGTFTARRFISKWVRQGTVAKERGRILIRVPEKLLAS